MYTVNARIQGIVPLLQHSFSPNNLDKLLADSKKNTGRNDYSLEWMETMYVSKDTRCVVQPASHIEGAMVKAAARFKIPGQGKRTWKDPIRAYCYVMPDMIPHIWGGENIPTPGPELVDDPTDALSVSVMRVVVSRSAVARSRLMIAPGWELQFSIEVHDDQVREDVVQTVLEEAGRSVGIGDYRPRYGRFEVSGFEVS